MYQISRTHLIGYLVEDGITSSVHAKHTFSRTSIMLRFSIGVVRVFAHGEYSDEKKSEAVPPSITGLFFYFWTWSYFRFLNQILASRQ